ncbi:MAG: hypothetical protein ACI8QC_001097 [Planctomycetota bacterium]|jgi:hypothetical protein
MQDAELATSLITQTERLPAPLVTFAECLAKQRDRMEADEEEFRLTDCQREQALKIIAGLERGLSGKDFVADTPIPTELEELAQRVRDLREQKKAIEKDLTQAADQLAASIGVGATVAGSDWKVRVGEPRLSVKVKDATEIPSEFLSLQPDRKAILAHVKAAAEVPAGVTISETKATLYWRG